MKRRNLRFITQEHKLAVIVTMIYTRQKLALITKGSHVKPVMARVRRMLRNLTKIFFSLRAAEDIALFVTDTIRRGHPDSPKFFQHNIIRASLACPAMILTTQHCLTLPKNAVPATEVSPT
jgi:hypothetical protein